uniref:SDS3 homolog, SIN3A corepressor complex component n=1 Tax=Felis catus TaxID=9685 RepID=A0ABI7ZBP4_FELCA
MSAAGLLAPAPAPAGAPPAPEYYPEEDEELESAEDDERSCRGRESDEDTEDASETDLAKHDEEDYVEMKEQMYQDKLASLKRQLQQLQEGTLQEYQKRMKKLDQQYKERIRNAELFLQLETEQVERNYIKEKKAAVKEFEDKKVELKENLIAELEEKKKMIENEKLTMELTGGAGSNPQVPVDATRDPIKPGGPLEDDWICRWSLRVKFFYNKTIILRYAKVLSPEYLRRARYYIKTLEFLIRLTDVDESWPSPELGSLVGFSHLRRRWENLRSGRRMGGLVRRSDDITPRRWLQSVAGGCTQSQHLGIGNL